MSCLLLLCFSALLALQLPRLEKRANLMLFVRLFDLRLFCFVCFLWEGLRFLIVALPVLFFRYC